MVQLMMQLQIGMGRRGLGLQNSHATSINMSTPTRPYSPVPAPTEQDPFDDLRTFPRPKNTADIRRHIRQVFADTTMSSTETTARPQALRSQARTQALRTTAPPRGPADNGEGSSRPTRPGKGKAPVNPRPASEDDDDDDDPGYSHGRRRPEDADPDSSASEDSEPRRRSREHDHRSDDDPDIDQVLDNISASRWLRMQKRMSPRNVATDTHKDECLRRLKHLFRRHASPIDKHLQYTHRDAEFSSDLEGWITMDGCTHT